MLPSSIQFSCPYYAKVTPHPTGFEESIVRWRDRARRANEVTAEVLFFIIPSMKIIHTYFFVIILFCLIIAL